MNVPITVIIPTLNRPDTLKRTLTSYISGGVIPDQIIVIDQTQSVDLRQYNKETSEKFHADYIYRIQPSLTAARNESLQYARNDIIVYSDDDIDVYPDTIDNVYSLMKNPDIAMIAGLDDNASISKTNLCYFLGTKSFIKRHIGHVTKSVLGRYPDKVSGEVVTEWAMGYFFVCRKSLLEKWDISWDERLISYAYAEDLDFSYRYCKKAKSEGLKCILSDRVRVKHMISREYRIPSKKSTYMYVIHRWYIADKNRCGSHLIMDWCDLWRLVERIIKHEKPGELLNAFIKAHELRKKQFVGMEELIGGI